MENTINERINLLITALGKNHKTFAESIGKAPTIIYNIVNGRNKPSFDVLDAICDIYPQVNASWILREDGDMFKATTSQPDNSYLQDYLQKLEDQFKGLLSQLSVKDKQLDGMQRTIDSLLGKPEPATNMSKVIEFRPVVTKASCA